MSTGDYFDFFKPSMPHKGSLLLSEPFLEDTHFSRSVILLCEHNEQGSLGYVLNKPCRFTLADVLEEAEDVDLPVYFGGPVEKNVLYFLHCNPLLYEGSERVFGRMYWSGDVGALVDLWRKGAVRHDEIKLFMGYSSWSAGQLEEELGLRSWIVYNRPKRQHVFTLEKEPPVLWRTILKEMGGKMRLLANFPVDPMLN